MFGIGLRTLILGLTFAAASVLPMTAWAADVSGNGTVTYAITPLGQAKLSDNLTLTRFHMKGVVVAEDASTPIHLSTQDCVGAGIRDSLGTEIEAAGSCDGVDKDGDVWWIWWKSSPSERTWGFMGGTGKYDSAKGGGTTSSILETADGRSTITWEGAWTTE